jgi:hypothetical protein
MTDSIIERAANAIEHEFVELADPTGSISPYGIADRVVRAVLQAIRVPSEGMRAACSSLRERVVDCHAVRLEEGGEAEIWQAMIDAALEEE